MTEVITSDGIVLQARADGAGPPLLLLNSLGTDLQMWDPQVDRWARSRTLLRFDQRGHGRSEAPSGPYHLDRLGEDALAVLDAFGQQRVDVCGLSLGGVVALWLAIHHPGRVGRLIVADSAARIGTQAAWQQRAATVLDDGMDAVADLIIERFFSPGFRAAAPAQVARMRETVRGTSSVGYAGSCFALADADLRDDLSRIVAPTLVLVGSNDVATPPADAQELAAGIAGSQLVELAGAGHLANLEVPHRFAADVERFLEAPHPS